MQSLVDMGFDAAAAERALAKCGGDVEQAAVYLLEGGALFAPEEEGDSAQELPAGEELEARTTLEVAGLEYRSDCGYCRTPKGNTLFGMRLKQLRAGDFERLLQRYWSRSGTWFYVPLGEEQCCPHVQIRVDTGSFRREKSHRRTQNKVAKALGDRLAVHWGPADSSEEKFALFCRFQAHAHPESDPMTLEGFERFLCNSPIVPEDGGLGSFHVEYRVDGELVGVSAVDVMPDSLNSGYFFWDKEQWGHLGLGTYSSLYEIKWAKSHAKRYWMPGWYIHTCARMNYKARFRPSELLCPYTLRWVPFDRRVRQILDERGIGRLCDDPSAPVVPRTSTPAPSSCVIKIGQLFMRLPEARMLYSMGGYGQSIDAVLASAAGYLGAEMLDSVVLQVPEKYLL